MNKTAQIRLKPRYRLGSQRVVMSIDDILTRYKKEIWEILESLPDDPVEFNRRLHIVELRKHIRLRMYL